MINLNQFEKKWIKICKGHYQEKYQYQGSWVLTLKPLFVEIYGWDPDEDGNYRDYLNCIFNKLLEIYMKIADDKSGTNMEIRGIFEAAFWKGICQTENLPIERSIAELCGLIHRNAAIEEGEPRYSLT